MTARTTRRPSARRRLGAAGAIAVTGALLLTGCGDQTEGGGSGDGGKTETKASDAPLFDKLPKKIQDAGVIKVGSDIAYAPMEFDDGGEAVGVDVDIAKALGEQLGVEVKFQNSTFDNLIPATQTGRFDMIMSAMTDTKDRQEGLDDGKKVSDGLDFVDYFNAGVSILVQKGNPKGVEKLDDLCGQTVAMQRGTVSEAIAEEQNKSCDKPMKVLKFDKDTEALLQVKQGRAVADLNDFPVAAYNAKTAGGGNDFEVVGEQIDEAPYGIAVTKKNTELRDALKEALDAIIENGEYEKVLKEWEVEQGAVDKAVINGGK
ncbi:ABC transporter substrate-binding protein [Streptomyces sp. 549]|uniref:ABC transporter substrate-binding protein n=1 Tax=Streptomyces sp. 549 TaxID=3049076 RepID=UPI0024C2A63C|nr:ABC transporter substrate-binding protein [Streptomyces sp. 549]MDK1476491.1 ABC transporter substrate-binding protein [Streptomyces sp. 549]